MEFINTHASAFFTLLSSAITIGIGFVFTSMSQSKKNKHELNLKEQEQKHNISEETYQNLFEKKIKVYNSLYIMLNNHKKDILNIGREEESRDLYNNTIFITIEEKNIFNDFFNKLSEYLVPNIFYISKELDNKFSNISLPFHSKNIKILDMSMYANYDDDSLEKEIKRIDIAFYEKYRNDINDLYKLLEYEIKLIKDKIDFD